jgi:hypothetical protein
MLVKIYCAVFGLGQEKTAWLVENPGFKNVTFTALASESTHEDDDFSELVAEVASNSPAQLTSPEERMAEKRPRKPYATSTPCVDKCWKPCFSEILKHELWLSLQSFITIRFGTT